MSLDRREFMKWSAAAGAVASLGGIAPAQQKTAAQKSAKRKTEHLVLIAFAGGVRTRETFGTPANVPVMVSMAEEGVLFPRARTANLGHFGAALSIFTGNAEQRGIRENVRGKDVTLFEYLRKDLGWGPNEAWIATSGGAQQVNYAYGLHPEYGPQYGANTLDGEGIFNKEFKQLIETWGRPREMSTREKELLQRVRRGLAGDVAAQGTEQVERFLLEELTRGTSDLTGANASDAKALRVARNLLTLFRPKLTAVVLQDADIAHGNYNGYLEVVRRNDAAIGELLEAVRQNPQLNGKTSFLIVPEFGRDADLNSRRGLDHGDGSDDLRFVTCLGWGPDFRRGSVVQEEVGVVDVAPTVCELFGAKARFARGKRLPGLFS